MTRQWRETREHTNQAHWNRIRYQIRQKVLGEQQVQTLQEVAQPPLLRIEA